MRSDIAAMTEMLRIEGRIGWHLLSQAAKLPDGPQRRNLRVAAQVIKMRCQSLEELIKDCDND